MKTPVLVLSTLLLTLALGSFARAQGTPAESLDNGLRVLAIDVPKAEDLSVALAIPVGWQHDPRHRTGLAECVRQALVITQRPEAPPVADARRRQPAYRSRRLHVDVGPRATLLWRTGPSRDAADRLAFVRRVLGGRLALSVDEAAIAKGRARLASDDQTWLYPGTLLEQKAWRTLLAGQAGGRQRSIPEEIAALDRKSLNDRLRSHYRCAGAVLVVIGPLRAVGWPQRRAGFAALPKAGEVATAVAHDSAPPFAAHARHDRINGPFVTAAWRAPAPGAKDFLPFVVGMMALRMRAHREIGGYRGREWQARFPLLAYRYWEDDPIVRLNRRGPDRTKAKDTQRRVEEFLYDVRRRGIRPRALDAARREVATTLAVPPFRSQAGPFLIMRARYLALATCLGWPTDLAARAGTVQLEDVNRVLRAALAPATLRWFTLEADNPPPLLPGKRTRIRH